MMASSARAALRQLARAWGVQTSYVDATSQRRSAAAEVLLGVLRALGAPVTRVEDATAALREHASQADVFGLDAVHVAWDGRLPALRGRLPRDRELRWKLTLDSGETRRWKRAPGRARSGQVAAAGLHAGVGDTLPFGHHVLQARAGRDVFETFLISAPRHAYAPPRQRAWGLFLPLYAVRSARNSGVGDYADLGDLVRWTARLGGGYFGTLPLLATFLGSPFEPSPYAPVSRLFWSDVFIDPAKLRGGGHAMLFHERELARCRDGDLVDYAPVAAVKRTILNGLAQRFFAEAGDDHAEFAAFLERRPAVRDYARFRAVVDRRREGWHAWPERLRDGDIQPGDYDDADERYHLYSAWIAERQLGGIANLAGLDGAALYLDLPLGVHRDGYEPWRMKHLFARDAAAGAPPDLFFPGGQDWGFPPMKPAAMRADRYAYVTECLRNHLRYAGALRVDHVMSLQRLYWIPRGVRPTDGVYVRYPLEELFAILALESVRHRAVIIGEDLGTVSREIRSAMRRHRVQHVWVLPFEASPDQAKPLRGLPPTVIASLDTHDMPTFAAYWDALDVDDRRDLGLLSEDGARAERAARVRLRSRIARQLRIPASNEGRARAADALAALLEYMAASPARILLINLEDLWLETQPQNVPGTSTERPNWRRRARLDLDQIRRDARILRTLKRIDELRRTAEAHA